eukprot:m.202917 g.202917  ORF g.202917 m.202917 type:complete len:127 (+) comp21967_c0_seq4:2803-3183(+)
MEAASATAAAAAEAGPEGQQVTPEVIQHMFGKISVFLKADLEANCEEYKLLTRLNELSAEEYQGMSTLLKELNTEMETVNSRYSELQPYLDQIDALDTSVEQLVQTAKSLDDYSRRLEARFKELVR